MDKLVNSLGLYIEARQSFTPYATDRVNEKGEYCKRIVEQMHREIFAKNAENLNVLDCPFLQAVSSCIEKDVWNKTKKESWFTATLCGLKNIASKVGNKCTKRQASADPALINMLDTVVLMRVLGNKLRAESGTTFASLLVNEQEDVSYLFSCYYPENPEKSLDELRKDLDQVNHCWCTFVDTTWEERRREEEQKKEEAERRYGYIVEAEKARANILREIAQKGQERTEYWHQTQQQVLRPQLEMLQQSLGAMHKLLAGFGNRIDNELIIQITKNVYDMYIAMRNTNRKNQRIAAERGDKELVKIVNEYDNYAEWMLDCLGDFGVSLIESGEGDAFDPRKHKVEGEQKENDFRNARISRSLEPGLSYETSQEGKSIVIEKELVEVMIVGRN